jgi:ribulose-5-phosphate 4-epimerase/fuculose-1-phosphate aldolase
VPSAAEVVRAARAAQAAGLVVGSAGNASARDGERVLITPAALPYETMEPVDVVALSLDGGVLAGAREPSSERRLHLAIYRARPDAGAVVHTHSVHATAWSYLAAALDTGSEELEAVVGGAIRTAPYAPSGSQALADGAVRALEGRRGALLERHGVVGIGDSPAAALAVCLVVERQAQIAWLVRGSARA